MQLLSLGLSGYRRFGSDAGNLDVSSNPIAIVGPNEVGKTSFLRALEHLNQSGPFEARELTRGGGGNAEVRAVFVLDPSDRTEIAALGGVGKPVLLKIWNRGEDQMSAELEPPLKRDHVLRERTVAGLARLLMTRWMKELGDAPLVERLAELHHKLPAEGESIDTVFVTELREVSNELKQEDPLPASASRLAARLLELADSEEREHPNDVARNLMFARRPVFLWFDENRRQIESSFSLDEEASPALQNLFELIDFDLSELDGATARGDRTRVAELTNEARDKFHTLFEDRWRQARVRVELDVEGREVHVFATNSSGSLIPIAERSEGLRQFIALMAFVEREAAGRDAIVLIDEAEQHLHYDAQADLVRVFSGQTAAKKIIYTTHSAGCLPHDLGMGVRVIEATGPPELPPQEWERSKLRNWFWEKGPGYSPLLMAMGAGTFAFAATRKAIVAEGISDALLLPTLFREALERDDLDIQVAPGLANVNSQTVGDLDFVASRIVYVVDCDAPGRAKRAELLELGTPRERVLLLAQGRSEITLEDLLKKNLYVAAVNRELELRGRATIPIGKVPDLRRKHAVEQWAEKSLARGKEDAPSERAVAHHLLQAVWDARLRGEGLQLLDPKRKNLVARLYGRVEALLDSPSYASIEKDDVA